MISKTRCALYFAVSLGLAAQAPPTIEQALAEKHIDTSLASLVRALQNPDPTVRSMAAMELASEQHSEEIPAIRDALDRETVTNTCVGIARALAYLHDSDGEKTLTAACLDRTVPPDLRLLAAMSLSAPTDRCTEAIASQANQSHNPAETMGAVRYLTRKATAATVSPRLSQLLLTVAQQALTSDLPVVRQQSVELILACHLRSALPSLRNAAAHEDDPETQRALTRAIAALS